MKIRLDLIFFQFLFTICAIKTERIIQYKKVILNSNGTISFEDELHNEIKSSTYLIAVTVQNNAHSLPTFLATLETLKCPNENQKFHLWFIFDECTDNSYEIFTNWLAKTRQIFDSILMINTMNDKQTKQNHPELESFYFSSNLKIRAMAYALDKKFDYILFLNGDTILLNTKIVEILVRKQKPIIAPLLTSSETRHSTFKVISGDEDYQSKFYSLIYDRIKLGCFKIDQVQESFLVDLKHPKISQILNLNVQNKLSDDENFSLFAQDFKIPLHVCNRDLFGYVPDFIKNKHDAFVHMRIEHLLKGPNKTYNEPLKVSDKIDEDLIQKTEKSKLGFDEIYIINLERRPDRRQRIESALDDLGISYKTIQAVDGRQINEEYIKSLGIKSLPDYRDPYNDRPLNYGEIGCFLSHYFIWKEMVEKKYNKIIIFEDDAKFVLGFKDIVKNLMNSINENKISWELLYFGRKIMRFKEEAWNYDVPFYKGYGLVIPAYSHWTVAYSLSLNGAIKLLDPEPLKLMLPVDEYLPIMFDKQPNEYWSSFFPKRDIIAYAIQPSVIYPTHYTGEPSHVSDTENTPILDTNKIEEDSKESSEINFDQNLDKLANNRAHLEL